MAAGGMEHQGHDEGTLSCRALGQGLEGLFLQGRSAGGMHWSLVKLSPLPACSTGAAIDERSSNWIIEVAPPRRFPESPSL